MLFKLLLPSAESLVPRSLGVEFQTAADRMSGAWRGRYTAYVDFIHCGHSINNRLQWHRLQGFNLTMLNSLPLSWMLYRDDLSTNFRMNWKWITNELAWIQNVLQSIHNTSRCGLTSSCLMTRASIFYRNLWSVSGLWVFRSELQSKVRKAPTS